jgi:hypothetical protein
MYGSFKSNWDYLQHRYNTHTDENNDNEHVCKKQNTTHVVYATNSNEEYDSIEQDIEKNESVVNHCSNSVGKEESNEQTVENTNNQPMASNSKYFNNQHKQNEFVYKGNDAELRQIFERFNHVINRSHKKTYFYE